MALIERRDLKNLVKGISFFFPRVTGFQTVERMSLWQTGTPLEIVEEGLLKAMENYSELHSHL